VASFDPYSEWLKIPIGRRPPSPEELLGVRAGETDQPTIEAAFQERFGHIRTLRLGPQGELVQQILNELSTAFNQLSHQAAEGGQHKLEMNDSGLLLEAFAVDTLRVPSDAATSSPDSLEALALGVLRAPAAGALSAAASVPLLRAHRPTVLPPPPPPGAHSSESLSPAPQPIVLDTGFRNRVRISAVALVGLVLIGLIILMLLPPPKEAPKGVVPDVKAMSGTFRTVERVRPIDSDDELMTRVYFQMMPASSGGAMPGWFTREYTVKCHGQRYLSNGEQEPFDVVVFERNPATKPPAKSKSIDLHSNTSEIEVRFVVYRLLDDRADGVSGRARLARVAQSEAFTLNDIQHGNEYVIQFRVPKDAMDSMNPNVKHNTK
jgi:hypothetical protein